MSTSQGPSNLTDVVMDFSNQSMSNSTTRPTRVKVYPEPTRRVRAKTPKTRTGCQTCKVRRVKCGEEKPSCLRCINLGINCDGYACNIQLCIHPTATLFNNQREHQYFLHFRDEVASDLSGPLPTNIWNYIILQATHRTAALRNLTISIAALRLSKSGLDGGASHRSFAIRQYGKALSELRQIISQSDDAAVRISLIASLLIFCFENIHGDHEQAVSQLRAALIMMRERLSTFRKPYSRLRTISPIPGFEDDIVDIFVRLDSTIMSRVAGPTESRGSLLEINYIAEDFDMPRFFQDITEAKNYLEHAQYKAMPYLAHMPDVLMFGDQYSQLSHRAEFDEIMLHLQLWTRAFQPLLSDAERRGGLDFMAAATLRVLALATAISTQRIFHGATCTVLPALFVPEAKEIVDLTRRIAADGGFKKGFIVDCGIVPALFVVLMICKDREVREDAIEVLESCGERMEATWNAAAVAKIGRQILEAEGGDLLEVLQH